MQTCCWCNNTWCPGEEAVSTTDVVIFCVFGIVINVLNSVFVVVVVVVVAVIW